MLGLYDPVATIQSGVWRAQRIPRSNASDSMKNITSLVTGRNRCKFFDRPVTPPLRQVEDSTIPDNSTVCILKSEAPRVRTVGTQTDYRESEAQTDPWDPLFNVRRVNSDPELLKIAELRFGSGLPVSPDEVEMIARARARKEWESTLPAIDGDAKDWRKRRKMVAEKENEEWKYRSHKMMEKQNLQLEFMEKCLAATLNEHEQRNLKMLERLHAAKTAKAEAWRSKVRSKLNQSVQFMEKKHHSFSRRNNLDAESTKLHEAKSPQNEMRRRALCEQINAVASSFYLTNPKGMEQLEQWFLEEGNMCMKPEIYLPKRDRRPSRYEKLLEGAHGDIVGGKPAKLPIEMPEIKLQMDRPVYRPPTPSVSVVPQEELDQHYSASVLQSTLRGRALQKEVLEGTVRNCDLISELRCTYPAQEEEATLIEENRNKHLEHYEELKKKEEEAFVSNEILAKLEGEALSEILSVSGKEVSHSQEEKRVQNVISRAKEERRIRESEEAGRRQQETIQRNITEVVYKETTEARENIVSEFVSNIFEPVSQINDVSKKE